MENSLRKIGKASLKKDLIEPWKMENSLGKIGNASTEKDFVKMEYSLKWNRKCFNKKDGIKARLCKDAISILRIGWVLSKGKIEIPLRLS